MRVIFSRLYIFEYKFNNVEDVNTALWKFNVCRHRKLIGSGLKSGGSDRVTVTENVDISKTSRQFVILLQSKMYTKNLWHSNS